MALTSGDDDAPKSYYTGDASSPLCRCHEQDGRSMDARVVNQAVSRSYGACCSFNAAIVVICHRHNAPRRSSPINDTVELHVDVKNCPTIISHEPKYRDIS